MSDRATVRFDANQKLYVFIDDEGMNYIPCIPFDKDCTVSRIPHMSWIRYRGLTKLYGKTFLRCLYADEHVYISPTWLEYIEDIDYRRPGVKMAPGPKTRTLLMKKSTSFHLAPLRLDSKKMHRKKKKARKNRR